MCLCLYIDAGIKASLNSNQTSVTQAGQSNPPAHVNNNGPVILLAAPATRLQAQQSRSQQSCTFVKRPAAHVTVRLLARATQLTAANKVRMLAAPQGLVWDAAVISVMRSWCGPGSRVCFHAAYLLAGLGYPGCVVSRLSRSLCGSCCTQANNVSGQQHGDSECGRVGLCSIADISVLRCRVGRSSIAPVWNLSLHLLTRPFEHAWPVFKYNIHIHQVPQRLTQVGILRAFT